MNRPPEYDALIRTAAFEPVRPTAGAIDGFLKNAEDYLTSAGQLNQSLSMQVFTCAYEGYFQLVQAVLEYYQVRTKEAGRNAAILRVCADLKMSPAETALVNKAHSRRNDTSYRSPFPPISKSDADALVAILRRYLPIAKTLVTV